MEKIKASIGAKIPLISSAISKWIDTYTWSARVTPVFIVCLPIAAALGIWLKDISVVTSILSGSLAQFLMTALFAQIGRDYGYRKQPELWESWGGAPTTQLLRHSNTTFNPFIRSRCHDRFKFAYGLTIPSLEEERENPKEADWVYSAGIKLLIEQTRDRAKFPLIFKENVSYGFRRNLWGLKRLGVAIALAGTSACFLRSGLDWGTLGALTLAPALATAASVILLAFWIFGVTSDWVKIPAFAYAERLLEACEKLQREPK